MTAAAGIGERYGAMFARLAARGQGAFVPFTVLGDPDLDTGRAVVQALVEGGADALELGIPFSDPIADGPAIQAAAERALTAAVTPSACLEVVRVTRARRPDLPIGLLVYANLVERRGLDRFYEDVAAAGVDSVLVADVPELERARFAAAAARAGVASVGMIPPNATDSVLKAVASGSVGYVYVVSRSGVTGADAELRDAARTMLERLRALGAPPALLGFGIAEPRHVAAALAMGAAGAISGSAVAERIGRLRGDHAALLAELTTFVRGMKAATRHLPSAKGGPPAP